LRAVLDEARRLGYAGPGLVQGHFAHAVGFAAAWARQHPHPPAAAADLGSGGGLPALPLAFVWPETTWLLVETMGRRAAFLRQAVDRLGLGPRVVVVEARAEVVGRSAGARGRHELVTARGVGPPAVAAELGAPLLHAGGALIVSEPPGGDPGRWPGEDLQLLGLGPAELVTNDAGTYAVIPCVEPSPERYPRKPGLPAKRPLFGPPRST
jgi:16S rRNA (guanine527-N7)-methyltransferase